MHECLYSQGNLLKKWWFLGFYDILDTLHTFPLGTTALGLIVGDGLLCKIFTFRLIYIKMFLRYTRDISSSKLPVILPNHNFYPCTKWRKTWKWTKTYPAYIWCKLWYGFNVHYLMTILSTFGKEKQFISWQKCLENTQYPTILI